MEIIDAGLNPNVDGVSLLDMQDDSRACFDARTLLDETLWQLRDILREIKRRSPSIDAERTTSVSGALNAWIKELVHCCEALGYFQLQIMKTSNLL